MPFPEKEFYEMKKLEEMGYVFQNGNINAKPYSIFFPYAQKNYIFSNNYYSDPCNNDILYYNGVYYNNNYPFSLFGMPIKDNNNIQDDGQGKDEHNENNDDKSEKKDLISYPLNFKEINPFAYI